MTERYIVEVATRLPNNRRLIRYISFRTLRAAREGAKHLREVPDVIYAYASGLPEEVTCSQ